MKHNVRLSVKEKINIWLDLCEFTLALTKKVLSGKELNDKMKRMRAEHLKRNRLILEKMGRLK